MMTGIYTGTVYCIVSIAASVVLLLISSSV